MQARKYNTTYMYYGSKKDTEILKEFVPGFIDNCEIKNDKYLLFFKIRTKIMIELQDKSNKTYIEEIMSSSVESIFKTKATFVTENTNIGKIINIKNTCFSLRTSGENGVTTLTSFSCLPKELHCKQFEQTMVVNNIVFNEELYTLKDYVENFQMLQKKRKIQKIIDYNEDSDEEDNSKRFKQIKN